MSYFGGIYSYRLVGYDGYVKRHRYFANIELCYLYIYSGVSLVLDLLAVSLIVEMVPYLYSVS